MPDDRATDDRSGNGIEPAATKRPKRARAAPTPVSARSPAKSPAVLVPENDTTKVPVDWTAVEVTPAETVDIVRGAMGGVEARDIVVNQGAIGAARARTVKIEMGALGATLASEVSVSRGIARTVIARDVRLEQSGAQSILADRVTMGPGSGALIVIARRVDGQVKALLDWRGALALGAAIGLVLAVVRPFRGRRG